jgi:UMF1 family MFS transporter
LPAEVAQRPPGFWRQRPVVGWALYDWANSAFSLTVVTAFVPVMLAEFWNDGAESAVTTFRLGMANGLASLVVALMAPLIGAIADRAGRRKRTLLFFTSLGVVMTLALALAGSGQWLLALGCFALATVGFASSNSLYDSLLVDVTTPERYDQVSAYGFALGYIGGALLFTLNVVMVSSPETFGLADAGQAVRWSFISVAVWWLVFTLPLIWWVHESPSATPPAGEALRAGMRELLGTLRALRGQRDVWLFLIAYWLYIDGVYTIIKMAVDFGMALGLTTQDLILAILITNYVGFPAALVFGALGRRYGPRAGLYLSLSVYILATIAASFITTERDFYVLAVCIGLVQGGVQSLSRSLFARLIPPGKTGEYFGFYNMLGKFAAIIGPILVGVVALWSGSQRIGLLSILVLFVIGLGLLTQVRAGAAAGETA